MDDLCGYLTGAWRLHRRTVDRRTGQVGRVHGLAVFGAVPPAGSEMLRWDESGELCLGDHTGAVAASWLVARGSGAGVDVRFPDGRLFHHLDLRRGHCDAVHWCGADRYDGRYVVVGPDEWSLRWRVRGPTKDQVLVSAFLRSRRSVEAW